MIILIDTSTPTAKLIIVTDDQRTSIEWEANRELAKRMLGWIETSLKQQGRSFSDITGIGVFKGPGSFTGLRIGMTVANALADSLAAPIVTADGQDWQDECVERLRAGENDRIVLPLYDRDANITKPRK